MFEYIENHDIIQLMRRCIDAMVELLLTIVEKLIDDPKILIGIAIITIFFIVIFKKRERYISRNFYLDKNFSHISKIQTRRSWIAVFLISILTDIITRVSYIGCKNDKPINIRHIYVIYYIPLFILYILSSIFNIHKEYKEKYLKIILSIIPGIYFHLVLILLILFANKSALFLGCIMFAGILLFITSDLLVLYLTGYISEKRVKIIMKNKEKYDIRYNDLIENKEELIIRIRTNSNKIEKNIIVKKEDVDKKVIYAKENYRKIINAL